MLPWGVGYRKGIAYWILGLLQLVLLSIFVDEGGQSGSSSSKARRYQKRGSPKRNEEEMAMESTSSPVRLCSPAESEVHSDGYR